MGSQPEVFELDHFFGAVSDSETSRNALEEAGFLAGPSNTHPEIPLRLRW